MKKTVGLILSVALLATTASCTRPGNLPEDLHIVDPAKPESVTSPQDELPDVKKSPFSNYTDILDTITLLHSENGEAAFRDKYPNPDERETVIFSHLADFICGGIGYCVKDINNDGVDELILLTENWKLRGLFTMQNGVPVFLDQCDDGGIGQDGKIRTVTVEETDESTKTVYRLKSLVNGAIVTEVEFGKTTFRDTDKKDACYQIVNGKSIEKDSYDITDLILTHSFRDYHILTPDADITCTRLLDIPALMDSGKYFTLSSLKNSDYNRTYFFEIYDKDGNTVLSGKEEYLYIYEEKFENGDTIVSISYRDGNIYYSIQQNRFSEKFQDVREVQNGLIAYFQGEGDSKRLTVQNIFDKNIFYKEYDYKSCSVIRFSEDGKSLTLKYQVSGNKNLTTEVLCLETLPILRTKKICYIRYGSNISSNCVYVSSGIRAVLRADTNDTIRLLSETPIIGGEYESEDGIRNDWYCIDYCGHTCYVTADSFEVDTCVVPGEPG